VNDIFSNVNSGLPPIESDTFTKTVVQEYSEYVDDASIEAAIGGAVDAVWPVVINSDGTVKPRSEVDANDVAPSLDRRGDYGWWPSYREHQREAVVDLLNGLYVDDCHVATLSAPTGAGKSLILYGTMAVISETFSRKSFFTTPLNALIDQIQSDGFIDPITLKGKNNYSCVHPLDAGTSVDNAICQSSDDFECEYKDQHHERGGCPYYGRKHAALLANEVVTNLSYLMANSMIPDTIDSKFDPRELLIVDECQSIEDFALQFVTVIVSNNSIPHFDMDQIEDPPRTESMDRLTEWLRAEVCPRVRSRKDQLDAIEDRRDKEQDELDALQRFLRKAENLLTDIEQNHWVVHRDEDNGDWSVEFEPIFIGQFLDKFLWSQSQKVILSSATIPKSGFLEEIGLSDSDVTTVEVESTFPKARRPVYTHTTVGKMTMGERDRTIPKMASKIAAIARHHEHERGFVHCRSYKIAGRIYDNLPQDIKLQTRIQDPDNRETSLDEWLDTNIDDKGFGDSEGGRVFLSVAQEEGISLDDWRARWQVIAKASYPYLGPEAKRANYRLNELNDWNWYASNAVIDLQQAAGRGMRSKTDFCYTYVCDTSVAEMIEKNKWQFEDWFLEAVDVESCDEMETYS